jgi:hypothetical protein
MRLGWIFLPEIWCGLTDPTLLVSIPTSNFIAVAWLISWMNMNSWKQMMGTLMRLRKRSSDQGARQI